MNDDRAYDEHEEPAGFSQHEHELVRHERAVRDAQARLEDARRAGDEGEIEQRWNELEALIGNGQMCDCGRPAAYDGLCYQCQTALHALGAYDMDGPGWR